MTYDVYRYIFYGGAILAAIMFIISLILFIVLKIPAVIGDLTGATAKKAIENIRNQNENTGEKAYKSSAVNIERGKLTDKISPSGNLVKAPSDKLGMGMKTEKISTKRLDADEATNETTVLSDGNETTVLASGEAMVLASGETTVLSSDVGETTLLKSVFFEIEQEITFIHTQEMIV